MGAKNKVVSGDYEGKPVSGSLGMPSIDIGGFKKPIYIDKNTVDSYEVLDEEHRKSASSAVGRAAVGSMILGPIGMFAGLSAKTKGAYYIAIQFKDGKKSLLEVDEKVHKAIVKTMF